MKLVKSQNKNFFISVIMSVYNDEKYLDASINSILEQTYKNFEFIILNDGSTDRSSEIIFKYQKKDSRIKYINGNRLGLTKKLNLGIKESNYNFIARHDSDDISRKDRLEKQINFFKLNPEYTLCGSYAEIINDKGSVLRKIKTVSSDKNIKKKLNYSNIFIHSSVMINKNNFKNLYYDIRFQVSQDYELWSRIAKNNKCYIIPDFLVKNRRHISNISNKLTLKQEKNSVLIGFLYKFNLELPQIKIEDSAKSFEQIVNYFSSKNINYKNDILIRKYVYLYKIVSFSSILRINFLQYYKIILFYFHKPSMLFKRFVNNILRY